MDLAICCIGRHAVRWNTAFRLPVLQFQFQYFEDLKYLDYFEDFKYFEHFKHFESYNYFEGRNTHGDSKRGTHKRGTTRERGTRTIGKERRPGCGLRTG